MRENCLNKKSYLNKKNLNKVMSLVLSVLFIFGMYIPASVSAEEINGYDYTKITTVLKSAGVLDQGEISAADLSSVLTRAEFADYMAKLLNVKSQENGIVYLDVPSDNLYAKGINGLAKSGILSVPEDLLFNPDMPITYDEALTIIIRATGYGVMAQAQGGFPTGFRYTASRLGIKVDTASEETLSVGEGLRLLFEGATVGTYSPDSITGDENYSFSVTDETLLSLYHNIYRQEGKLYSFSGASIGKYDTEDNEANIDGLKYTCTSDINADELLGNNVEIFYSHEKADESAELIYIEKDTGDKELVIKSEDIVSFDSQKFTIDYIKDEVSGKKASVSVPRSVNVVYNGRQNDTSVADLINSLSDDYNHGTISLKDTGTGDGYDLMVIKCYRTMALTGYNSDTLYDTLNTSVNICTKDYEHMSVRTPEGLEGKLHTAFPYIADVAVSADKEKLEIIICSDKVSGKVDVVSSNDCSVKIGDNVYKVNKRYFNENSTRLNPGMEFTGYLNSDKKICYFTIGASNDYRIGYLLKAATENGVFDTSLKFRIYDHATGTFDTYTTGSKLNIDSVRYDMEKDPAKVIKAFPDLTGKVSDDTTKIVPQAIRYKADANKVLTDIDTAALSDKENDDTSLTRIRTMHTTKVEYTGGHKRFDMSLVYDSSNTKVMAIPSLDSDGCITINGKKTSDVEKYFSNSNTNITADVSREMYGYNFDGTTTYADLLVYVGNADTQNKRSMMFVGFGEEYDEDNGVMQTLIVNDNGTETSIRINKDAKIPADLTQGDIISVNQAADNSATEIILMYDRETMKYKDGSKPFGSYGDYVYNLPGYFTGYAYRSVGRQLSRGYVYKKIGTFIQLTYVLGDAAFDGAGYECMDLNGRNVIVYDSTARDKNRVTTGTTNDIVDYKGAGNACTYMVVSSHNGTPGAVFIYK